MYNKEVNEIKMRVTDNFIGRLLTLAVVLCVPRTEAGVALGATRIIYPAEQKQVTLGVINSFDKDTFLIHSWSESNAGQKDSSPAEENSPRKKQRQGWWCLTLHPVSILKPIIDAAKGK